MYPAIGRDQEPKVFVVDDDISMRESLESLIRHSGWQTQTFSCAEDFLAHPRALDPCCLVLDQRLPDMDGLGLQKHLAATEAHMPIIFITYYGDPPMAVRAMRAGALEILSKPFRDEELLSMIQQGLAHSESAVARHAALLQLRRCYAALSRREREVMWLVVAGELNKQIAAKLKISEITVKAHRGRVMVKMNARSLPELVNMAIQLDRNFDPDAEGRPSDT